MLQQKCRTSYLGVVPYHVALELQEEAARARAECRITDTLLLLQHPHVITTGRFRGESDVLVGHDTLAREGIPVVHTSRGGSVTYHGPGQLVGYPIISLRDNGIGVREYIRRLEEVIIRTLSTCGLKGERAEGRPGVWVKDGKICSIGVRVARHVTMHGFALNVNCALRYFEYIHPCGFDGSVMTSMQQELGSTPQMESIARQLVPEFADVFSLDCEQADEYVGAKQVTLLAEKEPAQPEDHR